MVAGGNDYDLGELLSGQPAATLPTGLPLLDEFTGGIEQGPMWTISGVAGVGVSSLALTFAANAASAGEVIVWCSTGAVVDLRTCSEGLSIRAAPRRVGTEVTHARAPGA